MHLITLLELYNGTAWTMITGGPAFWVYQNAPSTQSLASGQTTKIIMDTKNWDTAGAFNNTASSATLNGLTVPAYSFMPPVAGYYQLSGGVQLGSAPTTVIDFFKNGSFGVSLGLRGTLGGNQATATSALIYLNGTSDYVDMRCYVSASASLMNQPGSNYFQGVFVRGV
jgi:hypothetical protein